MPSRQTQCEHAPAPTTQCNTPEPTQPKKSYSTHWAVAASVTSSQSNTHERNNRHETHTPASQHTCQLHGSRPPCGAATWQHLSSERVRCFAAP